MDRPQWACSNFQPGQHTFHCTPCFDGAWEAAAFDETLEGEDYITKVENMVRRDVEAYGNAQETT
jgi:hypothetical protein